MIVKMNSSFVLESHGGQTNFAAKGDSDSSVVDNEGRPVGFVFAQISIADISIIVDKNSQLVDIARIAKWSGNESTFNVKEVCSDAFRGQRFVLVQSARMVLERG